MYEPRGSHDSAIFSSPPSDVDMTSTYSGLQSSTRDPPPIRAPYASLPRHDYVNGTYSTRHCSWSVHESPTSKQQTSLSVLSILPNRLTYVRPCVTVIPLLPSDSLTPISFLLRLSAHHLALAVSASQPLTSGTLSLYLSVPVPVLVTSVIASRPTTASRPSSPLNPSPLAPQIRLLLTIVRVYTLYLLTYSLIFLLIYLLSTLGSQHDAARMCC